MVRNLIYVVFGNVALGTGGYGMTLEFQEWSSYVWFAICGASITLMTLVWLHHRWQTGKTKAPVVLKARPISAHVTISKATGTAYKPSVWMRLRSFVTLRKRLKSVPVLQRCRDELIAYSGYAFPGEVTPREIAASNSLAVHLERACFVLDEQGISHPEFDDRDIVIANYNEWRRFLTKLLARNDAQ